MLTPLHSAAGGGKALFATKNLVTKRDFRPHLCIFRRAGGQARKPRWAPEAALKRPASCSPSLFSPSLVPIFKENDSWKKKMDLNGNKTPYPPNPRHYGAVTLGGEGGKEHFGGATFGGAAVGRLGMSVLRDATYATLGARASLRALDPPHRTLSSHMTGLRAPHARTSAHAFACLGAAEAVPSLLLSLLAFAGRIQGLACETGLFRGVFRGCGFFIIF